MRVFYYKDDNLKYSSRKRGNFPLPHNPNFEDYKGYVLGNGAYTSIKTSADNICDYVIFQFEDGVKLNQSWFVIDYTYLNGSQVQLNLRRDVVRDFGISKMFGKVERGYTNTILKNRKELNLNQVLNRRIPIKSNSLERGNYSVNKNTNEMWGILYLTRQSENKDSVTIPIAGFTPEVYDGIDFIPNGTEYVNSVSYNTSVSFNVELLNSKNINISGYYNILVSYPSINSYPVVTATRITGTGIYIDIRINDKDSQLISSINNLEGLFLYYFSQNNTYYSLPNEVIVDIPSNIPLYSGFNLRDGGDTYNYTIDTISKPGYGTVNEADLLSDIVLFINNNYIGHMAEYLGNASLSAISESISSVYKYNCVKLSPEESGSIVLELNKSSISEPYYIFAVPLYDCTISNSSTSYTVNGSTAFNMFNQVIEYLSGENGYLVDAQIYPYCPPLRGVNTVLGDVPFFTILSNTYDVECDVNLYPLIDVKKEYIVHEYSLIAPDQSNKFTFNFYDYVDKFEPMGSDGKFNSADIKIVVKTCLKPFSIMSFAIPIPYMSKLNTTYDSDIRGCSPSSGGFECSIASNAFETYKRNNSNYQQIFDLSKQELKKQHAVERVNESVAAIVNTVTAAEMGAVAGASIGQSFGKVGAGIGAAAGSALSAGVVGMANAAQISANDDLRKYELKLQSDRFTLELGTIKNLPNSVNRISSFNEIIMDDFYYVLECYTCTDDESSIVDRFISMYGYGLGVYDFFSNYTKNGWFIRGLLKSSNLPMNLHYLMEEELASGVYIYEQI